MSRDRFTYTSEQIVDALRQIGVKPGDIVFTHVSLGRLGFSAEGHDEPTACTTLLSALRAAVGPRGSILTPSYTYSLGKGDVFDGDQTPSTVGPFSEYVRKLPTWKRSLEPMLAVSGEGPAVADLFAGLPPTSYGQDSIYDRLCQSDAWLIMVGLSLHWATFRHHIEELAKVPFRRDKIFNARIRKPDGNVSEGPWSYFAAPFLPQCAPDGTRLAELMRGTGLVNAVRVGIGEIQGISARAYRDASLPLLRQDPWLTARGPACPEEEILRHMNPVPDCPKPDAPGPEKTPTDAMD